MSYSIEITPYGKFMAACTRFEQSAMKFNTSKSMRDFTELMREKNSLDMAFNNWIKLDHSGTLRQYSDNIKQGTFPIFMPGDKPL